jgi:hypothetical protein
LIYFLQDIADSFYFYYKHPLITIPPAILLIAWYVLFLDVRLRFWAPPFESWLQYGIPVVLVIFCLFDMGYANHYEYPGWQRAIAGAIFAMIVIVIIAFLYEGKVQQRVENRVGQTRFFPAPATHPSSVHLPPGKASPGFLCPGGTEAPNARDLSGDSPFLTPAAGVA